MKILVADDDERILRLIADYLTFNKFEVVTAKDGKLGLENFDDTIDLVILDVMMPIYDGWIVCKEIRKISEVPIIILTAKDSDLDELFAFDIGVDDYVSKPFNIALLLARVNRLLKSKIIKAGSIVFKGIEVNEESHMVKIDGKEKELNPKEYELLLYFVKNVNKVISRETLLRVIWDEDYFGDTRTVDTHISRLRNKLEDYNKYLKTIRGFGYKFGEV